MAEDEKKVTGRQVTLRGAAASGGAGAELLAVLGSITESGTISSSGVRQLAQWLEANEGSELPAVAFLQKALEGTTGNDFTELYKALERVLPAEPRKLARSRRVAAAQLLKSENREAMAVVRRLAAEERERNRRLHSANFMVAGTGYEGRSRIIERELRPGQAVYLVRDPDNIYDSNAVQVCLANGHQIGFVPREETEQMAPILDRGCRQVASCIKILTGGSRPIPVIEADLYRSEADVPGTVETPKPVVARSRGCATLTLAVLVGLAAVGVLRWVLL